MRHIIECTGCPARSVHHVCSIHAKPIHPIFISFSDIVPWNMQIVCIESFFNIMIPSVFFSPLKIWSVSPIFWYQIILMSSYTSPEHPLEQLCIDFLLPTNVL